MLLRPRPVSLYQRGGGYILLPVAISVVQLRTDLARLNGMLVRNQK